MKRLVLLGVVTIGAACRPAPCYPEASYSDFTAYQTPDYPPAPEYRAVLEKVVACLEPLKEHWLSPEEFTAAECVNPHPTIELRSCIKVGVPPDWYVSGITGEEVFPCSIGPQRCIEKGLCPPGATAAECPCHCRAQIQDETTIWTAPNGKLLAAYAITLLTSCLSPWTPSLAPCANIRPDSTSSIPP